MTTRDDREYRRVYQKHYRQRLKREGRCTRCTKPRDRDGSLCASCATIERERWHKSRILREERLAAH
jgi:hypothetical protein